MGIAGHRPGRPGHPGVQKLPHVLGAADAPPPRLGLHVVAHRPGHPEGHRDEHVLLRELRPGLRLVARIHRAPPFNEPAAVPAHHGHGSSAGRSSRPVGGSFRLPPREPETGRRPGMVQHARSKKRACATPCVSRGDTPSHSVSYCVSLYHVHVLRTLVSTAGCFTAAAARAVCCATNQFSTGFVAQQTDPAPSRIVSPPGMAGGIGGSRRGARHCCQGTKKAPGEIRGPRSQTEELSKVSQLQLLKSLAGLPSRGAVTPDAAPMAEWGRRPSVATLP